MKEDRVAFWILMYALFIFVGCGVSAIVNLHQVVAEECPSNNALVLPKGEEFISCQYDGDANSATKMIIVSRILNRIIVRCYSVYPYTGQLKNILTTTQIIQSE